MNEIKFQFNLQKTIEAASILLNRNGGQMSYLGLLKLLYIADRECLKEIDQPITGDYYYSMKYGPVLTEVYDLIKGQSKFIDMKSIEIWKQYISTKNHSQDYQVRLLKKPDIRKLCEFEEDVLNQTFDEFGHLDPFDVAEWTHTFPEWQKPDPINSSIPIKVKTLLKQLGKTSEDIGYIEEEVEREKYLDSLLQ